MDIDARSFGQLEGKVEALTKMVADQKSTLEKLNSQLSEVSQTLSEAKGGWRTLLWIGGASASASAGLTWIIHQLKL